ncbi:MAG: GMC family oxidoreductase, partial [Rhodothermales bacterium]|nr:GMC family oxidoreductase [Rhodothermales bacterium]
MYTDFRDLVDGSILTSDVCVVGAGAAGIAIAHELSGSSLNVVLLESGGFEFDHRTQNLDQIEDVGPVKYPNMATPTSRVRRFGGTTNHWGGMSRPLDPIDFEVRPWVSDSGWPISEEELRPFYARANELCDAGPLKYDATEYWENPDSGRVRFPVSESVLQTRIYQYAGRKRFGTSYRRSLVSAPNIHVVTGAVVSALETDESAG